MIPIPLRAPIKTECSPSQARAAPMPIRLKTIKARHLVNGRINQALTDSRFMEFLVYVNSAIFIACVHSKADANRGPAFAAMNDRT